MAPTMTTRANPRRLVETGLAVALLATACGGGPEPAATEPPSPPTAGPMMSSASEPSAPTHPAVPPAVSINAVMVGLVDHAAHTIWDAGRDGAAPVSDRDWRELEHHAIQLAAAGSWVATGGSGEADPGWIRLPNWPVYAQEMTDASVAALGATRARDLDALLGAGDALIESCEGCHAEFKPDLPSEGIVHPH